jgi:alpha-galactosidase
MVWQFDRPDLTEGMVQAFRRTNSPCITAQYKLHALEPDSLYLISDLDAHQSRQISGQELMEKGLLITISQPPDDALITYKKIE